MHKQILLTGATGALGPAVAAELARTAAADDIAIMMRSRDQELHNRFARWREVVRSLLAPDEHGQLARFRPVTGDILQRDLGLDPELRKNTDVVVHAAADTNFSAPPERQTAINVGGTQHTLDWAASCPNLKRYILVSSVFASGSRTGRIYEDVVAEPPGFVTHYQRTKWESEHLALESKLPVGIARVSLILGSHETGAVQRTGAVHSLIKWFARGLVPMVPGDPDAKADVIATETAARCLARAVTGPWPQSAAPIWHIAAGDHAPTMLELIDFVYQHFSARPAWRRKRIPHPHMVEQREFDALIAETEAAHHPALAQALRSINRFLPDLGFPKIYDTTNAEKLWGAPTGGLPLYDWRETMDRIIRFSHPISP